MNINPRHMTAAAAAAKNHYKMQNNLGEVQLRQTPCDILQGLILVEYFNLQLQRVVAEFFNVQFGCDCVACLRCDG